MNKTLRWVIVLVVGSIMLACSFVGGFTAGRLLPSDGGRFIEPVSVATPTPETVKETAPQYLQELFIPFWEVWNAVHERYVDQPVDDSLLVRGAIRGLIGALGDPYSFYLDPQEQQDERVALSGQYEGIGAWVDTSGEYLAIISPMSGSPAESAGLRPGDLVIAIDGEDMTGIDPLDARLKVLGPAGTQVTLTILRASSEQPFDVTITRAHITVPSVEGEMLENDIAYVQIHTFGDNTTSELRSILAELMAQNPRGLILDLRNNGGGYLITSIEVASEFINTGVILYEEYGDGHLESYEAIPGGMATEIPMVVLVNQGTASASEIVAGAIQDYERAKLVGEITFGKGSVQSPIYLSGDQGEVHITIAKWLTPNQRKIHGVGLTPDITVEMTDADYQAERDPQLDQAIQVLLQLLGESTD